MDHEYNRNKKCKTLIVFDDNIADMLRNKKVRHKRQLQQSAITHSSDINFKAFTRTMNFTKNMQQNHILS